MSRPNPVDLPDRIVDKTTRSGWTRHKYADGVCWRLWKHRNGKTFRIQVFISDLELVYAIHGRNVAAFKLRDARRQLRESISQQWVVSM